MFETDSIPRLYALPPGTDFPAQVVAGVMDRLGDAPPEAFARVEIFVNTRRMQRRMKAMFQAGPAMLLPRIRLITDLAEDAALADIPRAISPLRRRLELAQLVGKLLDQQPDLAPRAALFDLADSLAKLMDEMQGEGVGPEAIEALDVRDQSGHWQRARDFIALTGAFLSADDAPDAERRQRLVVEHLVDRWRSDSPSHPVIVAGSTGSRGTTALFMRAVAGLPQGAVVLPGFDFDMPGAAWAQLKDGLEAEDHPQYRFARLLREMDLAPPDVRRWVDAPPPNPARNRLVSLALRPAPVTDQWMVEGPALAGLAEAAERMTLVEAPSGRAEAAAIALALREAVEAGRVAALITPDRVLTRQVTAALDRWGIVPDDSAGRPLPLSAPGRFLRHIASLIGRKMTAEALLTVLKHPLCNTGSGDRGPHLLQTRELELRLRRKGPPFPGAVDILAWAEDGDEARQDWARWLAGLLSEFEVAAVRPLVACVAHHVELAERFAGGPEGGTGELWKATAGEEALKWVSALRAEAAFGGDMGAVDYAALFQSVLQRGEVREATLARPDIMIWGTLEARVQGAELVILGSLNEGVWPKAPDPDPWLNRALRHRAGLLLPERQIGLAAHDFQQALAAEEVILTRSVRDAESQTVPSRWVNRLTNLLDGLPGEGQQALKDMTARGQRLVAVAERLDRPDGAMVDENPPAKRPSPRPPVDQRPGQLSVTEIQRLIRDPYAIYARHVLGLRPLDPLQRLPDAPLRGTVLHKVLERFVREADLGDPQAARARLMEITDEVLEARAPWPAAQRMWRAKLDRVADWFIAGEVDRQARLTPLKLEQWAEMDLPDIDFRLVGKIDRVDRDEAGRLVIYDYKTGGLPTKPQQEHFDKQLALAAVMAERGAIEGLDAQTVAEVAYIGLGTSPKSDPNPLEPGATGQTLAELIHLIAAYCDPTRGYTARRAMEAMRYGGDYDHLARFGEWDETDAPQPVDVGK